MSFLWSLCFIIVYPIPYAAGHNVLTVLAFASHVRTLWPAEYM